MPYHPIWTGKLKVHHNPNYKEPPKSIFPEQNSTEREELYFINRHCIFEYDLQLSDDDSKAIRRIEKNAFYIRKNPYTLSFGEKYRCYLRLLFYKGCLVKDISLIMEALFVLGVKTPESVFTILTTPNLSTDKMTPINYQRMHSDNPELCQSLIDAIIQQGSAFVHDCVIEL